MNTPNCPVCGMKPEILLFSYTFLDRYYTKISCKHTTCRIKPSFNFETEGGWPDDLSFVCKEWEYGARKLAENEKI